MPTYDASQDPPAPVARVTLRHPNGKTISDIPLLIDTGADITLLPRTAVERLGALEASPEQVELIGFDGSRSFASSAIAEVIFLNRSFQGRYLVLEQEQGILGRDVLNHLVLLLDGPQRQWSEDSRGQMQPEAVQGPLNDRG